MSKLMNATLVGLAAAALAAPVAYADVSDVGRPSDAGRLADVSSPNPMKSAAIPNPWAWRSVSRINPWRVGAQPNPMKSGAMPNPWKVGARPNPWRSLGGQRMLPWGSRGDVY